MQDNEAVRLLADITADINRATANVRALRDMLNPKPSERLVTPAEMEVGGWVRFPGTRSWRKISAIVVGHPSESVIEYEFGGLTYSEPVAPWVTLPYHTAAEFDAICDARQAEEDAAVDRLHVAEAQADRAAS